MDKISGIYVITNNINGKQYVGLSKDCWRRWADHYSKSYNSTRIDDLNKALYLAMRKYGRENFSFRIIEQCPPEELADKEKYWIQQLDTYHNGYNASPGGDNCGERSDGCKLLLYDLDGNFVKEMCNIASTARELGVRYGTVY